MLQTWKFSTKDQKVHVVSDCHWRHNKDFLFGKRGYNSIDEHDENGIHIWNSRVGFNDIVINCGDYIFNQLDPNLTKEIIRRLNGHQYYIWGNHNSGVKPLYYEALTACRYGIAENQEVYPLTWEDKFTFVGDYMHGRIDHVPFVASHYAYRIWDGMQKGVIAISGHSHGSDKESNPDFLGCKRIDVGIENFGGPIEFYELMKIMDKKKIGQYDHHDSATTTSKF